MSRKVFAAFVLAGLVSLLFLPATRNDFSFDDKVYLLGDFQATSSLDWAGVKRVFQNTTAAMYGPVVNLTSLFDVHFYGTNPAGHHVTNLLFHVANGVLVFLVLVELTGAFWRSAAVAALFSVHPMHVEPVAWISGRGDLMAVFFGFLSLLAWRRHLSRREWPWLLLAAGAFLLGMLSKSMLLTLPFALLLLDYWPLGRLRTAAASADGKRRGPGWAGTGGAGTIVGEKTLFFVITAVLVGASLFVLSRSTMQISLQQYPLPERIATSLVSYATYLVKTFWPTGLTVFYPHRWGRIPAWEWGGAALLLLGVTAGVLWAARRFPYLAVGWFWFVGTLLPVIGLYQAREYPIADRYSYLPRIGVLVMVIWGLGDLGRNRRWGKAAGTLVVVAALLGCLPASATQIGFWKDDFTLFTHALDVSPGNWMAHYNLGYLLEQQGDSAGAAAHYEETIRANPIHVDAYNNLGVILQKQRQFARAEFFFRGAINVQPQFAEAHYNLGDLLYNQGRTAEAIAELRGAVAARPDFANAHLKLGAILMSLGRRKEGAEHLREALRLDPGNVLTGELLRSL